MKIDHIGIAVKNLEMSLAKWKDIFNISVRSIEAIEERGVKIAQLDLEEGPGIELVSAHGEGSPLEKLLKERGEGIHHFCFEVENIKEAIEGLIKKGIEFVEAQPQKGAEASLIAFIHPRNFNSVLLELKEKRNQK